MRIFSALVIIFYAINIILVGATFIIFSLDLSTLDNIYKLFTYLYQTSSSRISIIILTGILLILFSYYLFRRIVIDFQREKTIAFKTQHGEVTIALSAVEDLIKQLANVMPEIKELRPDVIASKKGILVDLIVVLRSEANLPELTSRLQEMTRSKIQEVLGVEEEIIVRIHITKIISREDKDKEKKRREVDKDVPPVPYSGYGRV